ncbi:MAG: DNA helicase UvrD [Chloroflexi bacterium HGW-Chloroflexi-5]|jgi:DNA helicase-2/ATP-dependent DNA helicase PcrA|nr:MAG: DNA helicase UvrD [Chloroflexi bacterium HGW-Chloroflexi-5]
MKLNEQQRKAASFGNGVASVLAIPGSGKTLTMTHRIGNLIRNHGVAPENILGLTFTRNAAAAMKERLKPVLNKMTSKVQLQTIHAFCYSLLKNEGKTFEIITEKDQLTLIKKLAKKEKIGKIPSGMIVREIGLAKNNLITWQEFQEMYLGDLAMMKIGHIYMAYEESKRRNMQLDLNDLLMETYKLLKENKEVRKKYQEQYSHILVDEFQDTNPAQMGILRLLVSGRNGDSSFWVCGDDWQSIYAFTGASVGNILNFREMFGNSKQFILDMNYRSTPEILKVCQNLIAHNTRKIEKTLRTQNTNGESVIVLAGVNEEDESLQIVNEIKDLLERKGYSHKDIAILYRANCQSRIIEEGFSKYKIPYHVENGMSFYQRHEVKTLLEYLRFIDNPNSEDGDDALRKIINVPNRYIGKSFMTELEGYANQKEGHLYQALKTMRIEIPYLRKYIKQFVEIIDPLIRDKSQLEPAEMIGILRESLEYDRYITDDDVPSPDDEKVANVNQLQLAATRYSDIRSLLNYTDSFKDETSNDKDGVSLMTIHKAKGLEFPVVFVTGLIDGMLPHKNGDIEEERRIAFVGISRAMKQLYLTCSSTYAGRPVKRSPFLEEMLSGNAE